MQKALKYIWPSPITAMGLVIVAISRVMGGSSRVVQGTVEGWGGLATWIIERGLAGKVACMTLGHVILGLNGERLVRFRTHEQVHVRQYEKWGVLFVPLYLASSFLAWAQGKHCYRDNVFEQEAYRQSP
jgi:hypothetical protein